ncbi:hypothetical protein [Singulisphaera sp. PoT]|uniref:hypothetical protein n=1 Tax=Singulisphaera sp. PoT TaxID=3411797 RepID=UPI003BF5CBCC
MPANRSFFPGLIRAFRIAAALASAWCVLPGDVHAGEPTLAAAPSPAPASVLPPSSTPAPSIATTPTPASNPFTLIDRSISQDQGGWHVDYRLRHKGKDPLVVSPQQIQAKIEGWVSNSRVASHAVPRYSTIVVSGATGLSATTEVIPSVDECARCKERVVLQVWNGDESRNPPDPIAKAVVRPVEVEKLPTLNLPPGGTLRVRLHFWHQHFLYGDYDPLLGRRAVELTLGDAVVKDMMPLDVEQYRALPKFAWPSPPDDRRDTRQFVSAPDSLHLESHVPGNQYYRYPERPIRYGTRMRLRYWYLIASGTEGECRARISQYKDTPTAWKVLTEGAREQPLTTVGRWVAVEKIFRTEAEATTLALEFKISGGDIGEMWIDDVSLEPLDNGPSGP